MHVAAAAAPGRLVIVAVVHGQMTAHVCCCCAPVGIALAIRGSRCATPCGTTVFSFAMQFV
jgi:hypothetical protein